MKKETKSVASGSAHNIDFPAIGKATTRVVSLRNPLPPSLITTFVFSRSFFTTVAAAIDNLLLIRYLPIVRGGLKCEVC